MKVILSYVLILTVMTCQAQFQRPEAISVAYFGETITHPGVRIALDYQLVSWIKTKTKAQGAEKQVEKSIHVTPGVGLYYHRNYQTGLMVLPELSFNRKNEKGRFIGAAAGAGYMRTFIPNVYRLNSDGEIEKIQVGYNYFISNYSLIFGRDLSSKFGKPVSVYCKPQLLIALSGYSGAVGYFALELGFSYRLTAANRQ